MPAQSINFVFVKTHNFHLGLNINSVCDDAIRWAFRFWMPRTSAGAAALSHFFQAIAWLAVADYT